jgi:hypothetical protein
VSVCEVLSWGSWHEPFYMPKAWVTPWSVEQSDELRLHHSIACNDVFTCEQGLKNQPNLPKFGGFGGGRFFKNQHCSDKNRYCSDKNRYYSSKIQ